MSCFSPDASIRFGSNVVWLLAYQRNNKANGQKNLRCFPNHCLQEGHQRGFCGHSITVEYYFPVDQDIGFNLESFSLHAFAAFSEVNVAPFEVGSTVPVDYIQEHVRTTEHPLRSLMQGQLLRACFTDRRSRNAAISFEFNRGLKGWHYGFVGSKLTRNLWHTFTAYVMELQPGGKYYVVKAAVSSPKWQLYCRRRNKGPQALARRRISEEMQERFDQTLSLHSAPPPAPALFAGQTPSRPLLSPDPMLNFSLARDMDHPNSGPMPVAPIRQGRAHPPVESGAGQRAKRKTSGTGTSQAGQGGEQALFFDMDLMAGPGHGEGLQKGRDDWRRRLKPQAEMEPELGGVYGRRNSKQRRQSLDATDPATAMFEESKVADPAVISRMATQSLALLVNLLGLLDIKLLKDAGAIQLRQGVTCKTFAKYTSNMLEHWNRLSAKLSSSPLFDESLSKTNLKENPMLVALGIFILKNPEAKQKLKTVYDSHGFETQHIDPYKVTSAMIELITGCVHSQASGTSSQQFEKMLSLESLVSLGFTTSSANPGEPSSKPITQTSSIQGSSVVPTNQQTDISTERSQTGMGHRSFTGSNNATVSTTVRLKKEEEDNVAKTDLKHPPRLVQRFMSASSHESFESASRFDELRESIGLSSIYIPQPRIETKNSGHPKGTLYRNPLVKTKSGSANSIGSLNLSPMSRQRLLEGVYFGNGNTTTTEKGSGSERADYSLGRSPSELMEDLDHFLANTCSDNDVQIN